jgi:hypothetical protein
VQVHRQSAVVLQNESAAGSAGQGTADRAGQIFIFLFHNSKSDFDHSTTQTHYQAYFVHQ